MSDTKISALTDGTNAQATDRIPVARAGANRYITPDYIASFVEGSANLFTKAQTFQPDSDAQAGTFRRNSSGQTSYVVEVQTEANGFLAGIDKNGLVKTPLAYSATQTLVDQASIAWDMNSGSSAKVTLGGNRTLAAPTNLVDGGTYMLRVTQDGSGNRTLAYNAVFKWPGGVAPVLSTAAGAVDILTFVSDGTNLYGAIQKAFA